MKGQVNETMKSLEEKAHREQEKRGIAFRCLVDHPEYICIVKSKYTDDDMLIRLIETDPEIFKNIRHPSDKVIRAALEVDGANLAYIKKKKRKTLPAEFFMLAMQSNPVGAIEFIPKNCIPESVKQKLFASDPDIILKNKLELSEDFLLNEIKENPNLIKFVTNPSDDLKCAALSEDPNVALYYEELSPRMMDIIDEKYPNLKSSLPNYHRK